MLTVGDKTRRLAVLLIAPEVFRRHDVVILGEAYPPISDPAHVDYAELLSAYNYTFDIVKPENITTDLFTDSDSIRYSSIVLAAPMDRLSDASLSAIRLASYDLGISLVAAYDHPDKRSAPWFGIEHFNGKGMLWPLKANIIRWPDADGSPCVADYGVQSGIPGIRRRGLRKLSWRHTFNKCLGLMRSFKVPYMESSPAAQARVLATTMRGEALAWSYQFGNATNYYFCLEGDSFLDKYNEMHRLVRSALNANSGHGMVCADLDRTMVLRLDDPGASKADYVEGGCLLNEKEWDELGALLAEEHTPLSVMYTPGWVDDGDRNSGSVFINDELLSARIPGGLHDSARVKYVFSNPLRPPHDHVSEYRGLATLVRKRLIDVHSHGLTHLAPDYENWAAAYDKRSNMRWYSEFYYTREDRSVTAENQAVAMDASKDRIENLFEAPVTVLTPSSHKHDSECDSIAHAAGYSLFSADYTGIMKCGLLTRNWKIPALMLYFKEPSGSIAKAGYPIIGVIHDYEVKPSLARLRVLIRMWKSAGVKRYISLNSLTASLCSQIDASYLVKGSRIEVRIALPKAGRSRRRPMSRFAADVFIRIVIPTGCSHADAPLDITGGVVVLMEEPAHNMITMSVRVADADSLRIGVPLRQSSESSKASATIGSIAKTR